MFEYHLGQGQTHLEWRSNGSVAQILDLHARSSQWSFPLIILALDMFPPANSRHRRFSVPFLQLQWVFILVLRVRGWAASRWYSRCKAFCQACLKGNLSLFSGLAFNVSCGHPVRSVKSLQGGRNPLRTCATQGVHTLILIHNQPLACCLKMQLNSSYFLECPPESNSCFQWASPPV